MSASVHTEMCQNVRNRVRIDKNSPVLAAKFPPGLGFRSRCIDVLDTGLERDVLRIVAELEADLIDVQGQVLVVEILLQLHLLPHVVVQLAVGNVQSLPHALLVGPDVLHLLIQAMLHLILDQVDPLPALPVLLTVLGSSQRPVGLLQSML